MAFSFATRLRALCACAGLLALGAALPAGAATLGSPPPQHVIDALTRANRAVVGVQVSATGDAQSAQSLGRRRTGSGVVIAGDGLILTIGYLLLEADTIQVTTHDKRTLPARMVAYDIATGFGLLRPLLPLHGVAPVELGSQADLQAGDPMMVSVGGEDGGVGMTQLVGKRPFSGYWEYHIESALFTSPPVDDHSGAPLFNQRGELVGIGSLFVGDASGDKRRIPGNMFVPVDLLKPILAELQQTGSTRVSRRPWLGLSSIEQDGQVLVLRVNGDGPAQAAGLQPGDVVLAIDGEKVATLEAFYKKLWARPSADSTVELVVQRGAEIRQVRLQAVDRMSTMKRPEGI